MGVSYRYAKEFVYFYYTFYGVVIRCLFSMYVGSEEPLSVGTGKIRIPRFFCIGLKLEFRQPPKTLGQ